MSSIATRSILINSNNITGTTKAVFLTLLSYCHGKKDSCFPSLGDMEQVSGFAKRTIRKHLRILEELGFIETTKGTIHKSNTYKILGLYSEQKYSGTTCPQSIPPEGEKESYGVCSHQSKNQTHMEEEPTLESGNSESGASNGESPPRPPVTGSKQLPLPVTVTTNTSPPRPPLRFSGAIPTNQQVVEIYTLYTRAGFASSSEAQFLEFLSTCSAIARKFKEKKIRNFYGYLTHVWKNKTTGKVISDKDEDRARAKLRQLREIGLIDL